MAPPPCPHCGPYRATKGHTDTGEPICPRCEMTVAEHAYRERILADSAAVYAQEAATFRAKRAATRRAVA